MSEQNIFDDPSDLRKYRTELPNMVDDIGLSPYAYRLYGHIKRVAGASKGGYCSQSTETLAEHCKMSTGMISKAKQELKEAGLIDIEIRATDRNIYHYITIVDIWPQNFEKYSSGLSPSEPVSPSEELPSCNEELPSPSESKKEHIKNKPIEKNERGARKPRAPKPPDPEKEKRNQEVTQIALTLAEITGMDLEKNIAQLKKEAKHFSIEDLPILRHDYIGIEAPWYLYHWLGQKGERPELYTVRKTFKNLKPCNGNGNGHKPPAASPPSKPIPTEAERQAKAAEMRAKIQAARAQAASEAK